MNTRASIALSVLLWCLGLIPATLIALWIGLAEWSLAGAARAFVILAILVGLFEVLRSVVEKFLRARQNPQG